MQSGDTKGNPQLENPLQNKHKQALPTSSTTQLHHNVVTESIGNDAVLWHFVEHLQEHLTVAQIGTRIERGVEGGGVGHRGSGETVGDATGEFPEAARNGLEKLEGLSGAIVNVGGGEAADDGGPGLDVGEVAGAEHGPEDGGGVEGVAGVGGGDGEEAEAVGVEAVELALMAEARDDGLGAREARKTLLERELRDQAA